MKRVSEIQKKAIEVFAFFGGCLGLTEQETKELIEIEKRLHELIEKKEKFIKRTDNE